MASRTAGSDGDVAAGILQKLPLRLGFDTLGDDLLA